MLKLQLSLLLSLAMVAAVNAGLCVRYGERCPYAHHPENEPMICRDMGFAPEYRELCVPFPDAPECIRKSEECRKGFHPEGEPDICRKLGYPSQYNLLCVRGDNARARFQKHWLLQ